MTIYAVGGEADCFEPVSTQTFAFEATAGRFEANASRNALKITTAVSEVELFLPANQTEIWMHEYIYQEGVSAENDWLQFKTISGSYGWRIKLAGTGEWTAQVFRGAAWVDLGSISASPVAVNVAAIIDIHIKIHATLGVFTVFKNSVAIMTFTGDTTGDFSNIGRIRWKGLTGGSNELNLSQVVVASVSTVGWKLATMNATGNSGTNTAWTGDYTDVDEADLNTADFINTVNTGDVETYANADINAAYSAYSVKAVAVGARLNNDSASAVADAQAALRTASTNYFSASLSLPHDSNDYSRQNVWETNPNTTNPWTQSEANGLEFGLKSV